MTRAFALFALAIATGGLSPSLATARAHAPAFAVAPPTAPEADYEALIAKRAPAIVTIKFVLKMDFGGFGDGEHEQEATGVMIDPAGLVLVSNTALGGMLGAMQSLTGGSTLQMSIKPEKIRVLAGDDTVGIDAKLIARDTELDLAWVRVDKAPDKPYDAIDFAKGATPKLGDRLYTVSREGKFFDRVPIVSETRVAGIAQKPRHLYLGAAAPGQVAYTAAGEPVGFGILQMPSREDGAGSREDMFEAMFSGGTGGSACLPAAEVVSATKRALETAAQDDAAPDPKKDDAKNDKPTDDKGEKKAESPAKPK